MRGVGLRPPVTTLPAGTDIGTDTFTGIVARAGAGWPAVLT
jgi:hypothetical protein